MNNFTVVTPNFNMASYLAKTIDSVISNLGPGDKYYIVDGGSTDGSLDVIKKYEKYITGWISESDRGYADAIGKGFLKADTDFQCWINSGDLLMPSSINYARELFKDKSVDFIYGDDFYIDDDDRLIQVSNGYVKNFQEMMLFGGWTPLQDACFWRTSLYEAAGGIDYKKKYAADYDLFLKMSLIGNCLYSPKIYSAFRRHTGQTSLRFRNEYNTERLQSMNDALTTTHYSEVEINLKKFIYWWKARIKARMFGRKVKFERFEGLNMETITNNYINEFFND